MTDLLDVYEEHLVDVIPSNTSRKLYCSNLRRFERWLNEHTDVSVAKASTLDVLDHLRDLDHPSYSTIRLSVTALRGFYWWAQYTGHVEHNPVLPVTLSPSDVDGVTIGVRTDQEKT